MLQEAILFTLWTYLYNIIMKLLFLSDNYPPEMTANSRITKELADEWKKLGAEVSVITSFPNFPKGKIFKGFRNKLFQATPFTKYLFGYFHVRQKTGMINGCIPAWWINCPTAQSVK